MKTNVINAHIPPAPTTIIQADISASYQGSI